MSRVVAADPTPALWLIDKPAGPTSHDVVAGMRRALGRGVRVGHAGTLDPFATGLLVVLSGRATRLAAHITGHDKRYLATIRTGYRSHTGDPEGPITPGGPPADAGAIADALASFRGPQRQRVPAFAAVKVDGERLYAKARRGETVDAPEREIVIHSLELVDDLGDGMAQLAVHCSKGTYIRQLAMDIGEALGCGAHCSALRRTHVGELSVAEAIGPDRVRPGGGRDPLCALGAMPRVDVSDDQLRDIVHGRSIRAAGEGELALVHRGCLLALAHGDGGLVRPHVVFRTPTEVAA
ncbi:MAG TPA: tRNA pseudouridine(55) synthase TruB [Miltoncostaeaceae bacterium]|nr:tRNA pseudouridine(55) synthase TruB [Miltoncostaeaceae bacterium]